MGMRVGGSGSVNNGHGVGGGGWKQRQQVVQNLMSALSSGDAAAAQKAYAGLTGGNSRTSATSPLGQIGQALRAGDLAGAQKAAQSWQAARGDYHHGHQQAVAAPAPAPAASDASPTRSGVGTLINLTA